MRTFLREVVYILDLEEGESETSQNNLSSPSTSFGSQPSTSRQYSVSNSNDRFPSHSNSSASPSQVEVSCSGSAKQDKDQRQNSVLENFRTLFKPYNQSRPLAKRARKSNGCERSYKVKETWTHDLFCLADSSSSSVPSRAVQLQFCRKKIIFGWKDNPFTFKANLEEIFPRLVDGGGFEILRSGVNVQSLVLIPPPAAGYSVPFLRDMPGLGQALAYVRPVQRNLNIAEVCVESDNEVLCTYSFTCNSNVLLFNYFNFNF